MVVGILLWLACVFFLHPPRPPVGTYIACLAALAVVVTIWPPESNWSKAGWLLIFFACTGLEIATLYQERTENQKQQADVRSSERSAFQSIVDGLKTSISNNQLAFSQTMKRMERLDALSRENVDEVTGGNGFATLEPSIYPVDKIGLSLTAIVHGKHIIRGVKYTLEEGVPHVRTDQEMNKSFNDVLAGRSHPVMIGDLTPKLILLLGVVLHPSLTEASHYIINIYAMNGGVSEQLSVMYDSIRERWNYKMLVTRMGATVLRQDWLWPLLRK